MNLDLEKFSKLNSERAIEGFKCYKNVPITYWTTALAGEIGELCNMIKKMERVSHGGIDGGSSYTAADINKGMLEEEIGGIFIYLDLLCSLLEIHLQKAVIETFNSKSEKYKFKQFIDETHTVDNDEAHKLLKEIHDKQLAVPDQDLYWRINAFLYPYGDADFKIQPPIN